jgi:Holliday junction resolvase RusA-like endonuclease
VPELRLEIAGVPPSGNHYKNFRVMPTRNGKSVPSWYHTAKAKEWFQNVAAIARGRKLRGATYTVSYVVFTGSAVCTDLDNYAKCILDSISEVHGAGVIDNDKKVINLHGYRRIDRGNPRTVIVIRTDQGSLL